MLKDIQVVAVYGSLKRGFGNFGCMERANGIFIGKATSVDSNLIMEGCGYPFLIKDDSDLAGKVAVELFVVGTSGLIGALDSLEGHPKFYKREKQQFIREIDGESVEAWVYIYQGSILGDESLKENGVFTWTED